jgi:arylsulfatase A-like enzyme
MANTFIQAHAGDIATTTYVSGNIYTELLLKDRRFPPDDELMPPNDRVVPVVVRNWTTVDTADFGEVITTHRREDAENNSVPPRPITDAVIYKCRTGEPERVIAHYMQPHEPYIGADRYSEPGWLQRLSSGEVSKSQLWTAYLDNLRFVLDEVALLVDNVDAERVVITADHGEVFGEWGSVGHTICFPHPAVRKVPFVETTAVNKRTHEPEEHESVESGSSREEMLQNLGYL